MKQLGYKPLTNDVPGNIAASETQELALKPQQMQKTSPHFFNSVGKTVGKVGSTIGSVALSAIVMLD